MPPERRIRWSWGGGAEGGGRRVEAERRRRRGAGAGRLRPRSVCLSVRDMTLRACRAAVETAAPTCSKSAKSASSCGTSTSSLRGTGWKQGGEDGWTGAKAPPEAAGRPERRFWGSGHALAPQEGRVNDRGAVITAAGRLLHRPRSPPPRPPGRRKAEPSASAHTARPSSAGVTPVARWKPSVCSHGRPTATNSKSSGSGSSPAVLAASRVPSVLAARASTSVGSSVTATSTSRLTSMSGSHSSTRCMRPSADSGPAAAIGAEPHSPSTSSAGICALTDRAGSRVRMAPGAPACSASAAARNVRSALRADISSRLN
eukprot:scaffold7269_cov63-Phaeocystis_antarctica.AAC.4